MTEALALVGFFAACLVAGASGAVWGPGEWYRRLRKPAWNPPDWLFPIAWAALYAAIAVAAWLVWRRVGLAAPVWLWFGQLLLNGAWSWVFFGLRRPALAFAELTALWIAVAGTVAAFAGVHAGAAWLMAPYLVWVTFAGALNLAIWRLNGPRPA